MLHKMGVGGEIVFLAVLKDKDAIVGQQPMLEDKGRDRGEFLQGVWRVGKDKIKLLLTGFHETENIATQGCYNGTVPCLLQLLQALLNKTVVITVKFYTDHLTAATREEFKGNAACT